LRGQALRRLGEAARGTYGIAGSRRTRRGVKGGILRLGAIGDGDAVGHGGATMMAVLLGTSTRLQRGFYDFLVLWRVRLGLQAWL
jgi:hypothetical protein